ncbi:MAG: ABC transporter permease [Clostridiales bacterium]|nr:ABC transporter permease [Clostridiales bacterium]
MKNNIWTIASKEFNRFFRDKRMIMTLVMPAIVLYCTYSFLLPAVMSSMTSEKEPATVYAVNLPDIIKKDVSALNCTFIEGGDADIEDYQQKLSEDEDSVMIVFPAGFIDEVNTYEAGSDKAAPNVEIYYNSVSTSASAVYGRIVAILDDYESSMSNRFDINRDIKYDLASEEDVTGMLFSQLMPILLMMFLFTGCMSFAPDSIAGEKERGTIATMLVTPINRYEIVVGKIIAFGIIAVLSGGFTFAAVATSIPNLVGIGASGMSFSGYVAADYVLLLLTILTTALLMISAVSLISAYAKTTKEAVSLVSPLMILVIFISMTAFQGGNAADNSLLYLIPFYNSVQSMVGVFSYSYSAVDVLVGAASNLVYSLVLVFAITKMFNNERVMFSK